MGYACPVCDDPQSDAAHLANHLAFTAMLRGGDHEDWLDEHVPEWGDLDERALGERVADLADQTEFPQVFEDTTGETDGSRGHDHGHGHGESDLDRGRERGDAEGNYADLGDLPAGADALDGDVVDEEMEEVLAEAREMTEKRRGPGAESDADEEGGDGGTHEGETE